jgi:EAL domain-containing protein (putative c-di-GMP-specific phosphodiesterase class I)
VMHETIRLSTAWRALDPDFRVWFNVSPEELNDPQLVARLAAFDGIRGVGVEITESAAMRDIEQTLRALDAFRRNGLSLALDDFGTGYSSLSQLKRLEIDVLKIDRLFVSGIPHDEHDVAIVEAVVSIAEKFGLITIAEGVETLAQVAYLASIGCTYGQGYAYAHPMPAEAFGAWLASRRPTATGTLTA